MPSKSFRYKDSAFSSNRIQSSDKIHSPKISTSAKMQTNSSHTMQKKEQKFNALPLIKSDSGKKAFPNIISFDKLKNLNTDDYILLFLIFMLIKDNDNPDWPLIGSLGYILFGFDE